MQTQTVTKALSGQHFKNIYDNDYLPMEEYILSLPEDVFLAYRKEGTGIINFTKKDEVMYIKVGEEDNSTIAFIKELRARNRKLRAYLKRMCEESDPETDEKIYCAIRESMEMSRAQDDSSR